ncbi:MAG TPA: nuclear transport factor 2 family protein [Thermoanaerobaculia bacterium]|nr:nuclear transport factor 2 family protein [Thermoanaerobaculia bacterium]
MAPSETSNLATIREYLEALETGVAGEELARFFCPEAQQIELPSRLNPQGGSSDLSAILNRAEQGRQLLRSQRFELRSAVAQADRVAIEAVWTGILAVPFGSLAAGDTLRAHLAIFFELIDGKIRLQRNYDCFEP